MVPAGLHKERIWRGRFVVAVSWIEGGLKINSDGMPSSSLGGKFRDGGGSDVRTAVGAIGESDMVSN